MKYLSLILKIVLALPLLIFGLNKLMPAPFIQMPPPAGAEAQLYMQALFGAYLAKAVGLVELIAALLLFVKKWENIALVILFPISLNILLYHLFHDIAGTLPGAVIFILNTYFLVKNDVFKKLT